MRILFFAVTFTFLTFCLASSAVADNTGIPNKPKVFQLVYDSANILKPAEKAFLERKLVAFSDTTSNQILVYITATLRGYTPNDFAERLGQQWGVGKGEFDNGVVLLIKPTGGPGERKVHIAVGYGLESVIPDAIAKRIVDQELIPNFKNRQFYKGIDEATSVLMSLAVKEYSYQEYSKKTHVSPVAGFLPIVLFVLFFWLMRYSRRSQYSGDKKIPFWTALLLMSSFNSFGGRGNWDNFSSGSGSFGGGSFGGGGFGGGGAGGSW